MGVLGRQDSGLEILLGEGGDVELGARTSKHIIVFAFDPLVSKLSLLFVLCIALFILLYHSYHILLVFVPCIFHIAISLICLDCLCVPHLYLTNKSFT